jgi:nucleoside-diphosphate-sugar epimerase
LKKKIFITGISSQLIQRLIAKLDSEKFQISGISRKTLNLPDVNIINASLQESEKWMKEVENSDIIIHAAAITHTYEESEYFKVNFEASIPLIDFSSKNPNQKFIYISSKTACKNSGGYGISKLKTEDYLQANHSNFLIIRPAEIFGGGKNEGIDNFIIDACHKKILICPIQIPSKLTPIYIDDVVNQIRDVAFDSNLKNTSVTIQGEKAYSMYEIIKLCNKIKNFKSFIIPVPKVLMFIIMHLLRLFKLKVGIFPDQIERLYCLKENQALPYNYHSLESFIESSN